MPKHPYAVDCACPRCTRERQRRAAQSAANRPRRSRPRAQRIREEYWDAWESGRPEWDEWPLLEE